MVTPEVAEKWSDDALTTPKETMCEAFMPTQL
jgi:hypothetical protein